MREDIPLRKITIEEVWAEVQRLRNELQTHTHLGLGGSQLLTGEVNGIIQSPNFVSGVSGWRFTPDGDIEGNSGTFRGNLIGNSITGATITGGIFQTATSGQRTEITAATKDIRMYDTSGKKRNVLAFSALNFYDASEVLMGGISMGATSIAVAVAQSGDKLVLSAPGGFIEFAGSIKPSTTNAYDIGSDDKRIKTLHLVNSPDISSPAVSACRAYRASSQTIPYNSLTKIQFDTEHYDILGEFDKDTNHRFTALKAGIYQVISEIQMFYVDAIASIELTINFVNGTPSIIDKTYVVKTDDENPYILISDIVKLDAGGYIEANVKHAGGSHIAQELMGSLSIHRLS